jgi:serine/threonine-protein kinase
VVSSNPVIPVGSDAQVGKYRLLRRIAAGGMAEVYLATDDGKSLWAVKLILPHLADQPEFLGLFLDEARLASLLNHPNVARVRDMGMENGRLFLAMEYARGQPLSSLITKLKEKGSALTPAQAAGILAQAAAGLNAAHDAKGRDGNALDLVHRDVSPQNLLLTEEGVVKVVDFGIAKAKNKLVVTQVNTTRGKPWYMGPEQMRGEKLDRRADIFSLGAVLFELMMGSRLFEGDVDQVMYKALNEPLPDIRALKPEVPQEIADIIKRACARRPEDRFETAWEMEQELRAFAASLGGEGDLGALVRDNFPRMPSTVEELTGVPAASASPAAVPSPPVRPVSKPGAAVSAGTGAKLARPQSTKLPGVSPPGRIRRPGSSPAGTAPTVGEAPPDEKTPANPLAEAAENTNTDVAPRPVEAAAAAPAPEAPPPGPVPAPAPASAAAPNADDAVKVRTEIPKRGDGAQAARRKKMMLIGGIGGAVLLLGGGAGLYFAFKPAPPAPAPPPAPAASLLGSQPVEPPKPANPFAAVDTLPKAPPPAPAPTPDTPVRDLNPMAKVRVSCSDPCYVSVDGQQAGASGEAISVKPGKHTFWATVGDDPKRHGARTLTLKPLDVVALHFGKTDGRYLVGTGPYSYEADAKRALSHGDYAGAVRNYRMALSLSPTNPGLHRDLGKALYKQGDTDEAKFQLESYLLTAKSPKDGDEINALVHKITGR